MERPSRSQQNLLEFIEAFVREHGYGPSYREIMRALDYKSVSTVAIHIDGLIAKGQLKKHGRSARSLEVVVSSAKETPAKGVEASLIEKIEIFAASPSTQRTELEEMKRSFEKLKLHKVTERLNSLLSKPES